MEWLGHSALLLGLAFALDATLGEPPNAIHPVVWMGRAIAPMKRGVRFPAPVALWLGGLYGFTLICGFGVLFGAAAGALATHPVLHAAFVAYALCGSFALKGLVAAGDQVQKALLAHDLAQARVGLGSLCSRDASELSAAEVAGASIESLTENLSDSVVAPLFYFALFGLSGAILYRTANTMDAMVGYRGKYEYLGKIPARFDDALNLIPARLSVGFLWCAGALLGLDTRCGLKTWWRDRYRTESPNAGHPMAMAAGLLGVRLDKRGVYTLGAGLAEADARALERAQKLTRLAGVLAVLCVGLVLLGLSGGYVFPF